MLVMRGSYRGKSHFARRICDLALQIRFANPGRGQFGASEIRRLRSLDKKTLHCVVKTIRLLPRTPRICGSVCGGKSAGHRRHVENARYCRRPKKRIATTRVTECHPPPTRL